MAVAELDRFTVHARLRRGWSEDAARTVPKVRRWGATQGRVYALILDRPEISYDELLPHVAGRGSLDRALDSLERRQAIAVVPKLRGRRAIRCFVPIGPRLEVILDRHLLVEQRPFINPIRARALGIAP